MKNWIVFLTVLLTSMTVQGCAAINGETKDFGIDGGNKEQLVIFIEGTLYWKSRVLFSGTVNWGGDEQESIPVEIRYFNRSSVNKNMINSIKVGYK